MKFLTQCITLVTIALASPVALARSIGVNSPAQNLVAAIPAVRVNSGSADSDATAPADGLNVGIIIYDHSLALDFVGPVAHIQFGTMVAKKPARFTSISTRSGRIQKTDAPGLFADYAYTNAPTKFDVLMIPGGSADAVIRADTQFIDYIKRASEQSTYVLTICTGANILAATGLLDGRNATTNKINFKSIAALNPQVEWVRHARWVVDGKFWTSSGVTAGMDMGHAFIRFLYGKDTAVSAAEYMETVPTTDASNDPFEYSIDLDLELK